jgi:hypothetical protein
VKDVSGVAIPTATVTISSVNGQTSVSEKVGRDGTKTIAAPGISFGQTILAAAPGYLTGRAVAGNGPEATVVLHSGGGFDGQIVDQVTQLPVAGVQVVYRRS